MGRKNKRQVIEPQHLHIDGFTVRSAWSSFDSYERRQRRSILFNMEKGLCHYCKQPTKFWDGTEDHIVPKSQGGSNDLSNLVFCCKPCNKLKGTRKYEEFVNSMLRVRSG